MDILDWLHFNQVLVFGAVRDEHHGMWVNIIEAVKSAVAATGRAGVNAEILKHYVICVLEIYVTDETIPDTNNESIAKLLRFNKTFFAALQLANIGEIHGIDREVVLAIVDSLYDTVQVMPVSVRHRFAERCLAVEYPTAALEAFVWFVRTQIIPCAKYVPTTPLRPTHAEVIARVGLLCEFEMARKVMRRTRKGSSIATNLFDHIASTVAPQHSGLVREAGKLYAEKHFGADPNELRLRLFSVDRASDDLYVADFLDAIKRQWARPRLCQGTAAGWPGILGAYIIFQYKIGGSAKPLYNAKDNRGTLSDDANAAMKRFGFTVDGRTLYEHYRKLDERIFGRIEAYSARLDESERALPADDDDAWYVLLHAMRA
jgi:hypothetical protein